MDLELRALLEQGFEEDEARALVRDFSEGKNPDGRFVFHFTTPEAATAILKGGFKPGVGYQNLAVYAGTTPTPGRILKGFVWGLWNKPARIPIDTRKHRGFKRVRWWPLKTVFCRLRSGDRLVLGMGIVKWKSP